MLLKTPIEAMLQLLWPGLLKLFTNHPAQDGLQGAVPLDILAQGVVDQRLIVTTALLVDTPLEPGQDVLVQTNGDPVFGWGQRV